MPVFTIDGAPATLTEVVAALGKEGPEFAYVPKARLDTEINARKALEAQIGEMDGSTKNAARELAKLRKDYEALNAETGELRTAAELGAIGITDAKTRTALRAIHAAEMAGAEKPVGLAEWIQSDAGKAHPVVARIVAPAETTTATQTGTGAPTTTAGTLPVTKPGVKKTEDQLRAYFGSAEYRALPAAEKLAMVTRLEAESKA